MSHHPDGNNSRVRHVPIHVERRDGYDGHDTRHENQYHAQDDPSFQKPTLPAQFRDSPRETRSSRNANTTNIDINYQSPSQRSWQQQQQREQSNTDFHSPDQTPDDQSAPMEGIQNMNGYQGKENSDSHATDDSTCANEAEGPNLPAVIPLPPPPEQPKTPKIDKNSSKQSHQQGVSQQRFRAHQDKQEEEEKKLKKPTSPVDIMNSIQNEIDGLLKEIISCEEISQDSKEYRRLDEFLTRCILKLDNIDCSGMPDLRTRRKAIILRIDRCTDLLKKKITLNHDIQVLIATMSQES